jgi:hypothetical protein
MPSEEPRKFVPGHDISAQFLELLQAPPHCTELAFSIKCHGLLVCRAVYYTDVRDETAVKEWEVQLPEDSLFFYTLLTGK